MKEKKILRLLAGIGLGVLLGCIIIIPVAGLILKNNIDVEKKETYYSNSKMREVTFYLKRMYIESMEEENLKENIFTGYVYGLEDPASMYLDKESFKQYKLNQQGKEIGTGLRTTWGLNEQYLWVTEVRANTPASKQGIKVGDKIIKIDEVKAIGSNEMILMEKLTPPLGEKHIFTIEDKETGEIKEIALKSDVINIASFTSDILEGNIGYIKVKAILQQTAKEVEEELHQLEKKNIHKVVLDIRGVRSTNTEWTRQLCDLFLDEGICFSVMDSKGQMQEYRTQDGKYNGEVVILIDSSTSGPIEAFAAAMQYYNRAKLIGTITRGQTRVQTLFDLEDGTGVLISTGKLYTPTGEENEGVEADMVVLTSYDEIISLIKNGTISVEEDQVIQAGIGYLTQKEQVNNTR